VDTSTEKRAAQALWTLATVSGGEVIGETCGTDGNDSDCFRTRLDPRPLLACVAALGMLAAWGLRARRVLQARAAVSLRTAADSDKQEIFGSPSDVSAAAAESAGIPSASVRFGAFAGFRPLQPGDKLTSAVLQDLVLMGLRPGKIAPRIVSRIAQAAPKLTIVLDLGASVRVPTREGAMPTKVMAITRVAELLAGYSVRAGGVAEVRIIGVQGTPPVLPPEGVQAGADSVAQFVQDALLRASSAEPHFDPLSFELLGAVVLVSDFLLLDLTSTAAKVPLLEDDGTRFGAVVVYSHAEFDCVEHGHYAGSGAGAFRGDWTAEELALGYAQFHEQIAVALDDTVGGVVFLASEYDNEGFDETLRDSRLLTAVIG
jgi:hypothetical protein